MRKYKSYFIFIICSLTILGVAYFYFSSSRYYIANSGDKKTYKIDRWTGETWLLTNGKQIKIKDPEQKTTKSDSLRAIELAKGSYNLPNTDVVHDLDNDFALYSKLSDLKGDLNIIGWSSKKISNQTYLVGYKYKHNGNLNPYYFEVNLSESIVRYINEDLVLLNKYQSNIPNYSSLKYLYFKLNEAQIFSDLPNYQKFKNTLVQDTTSRRKFFNVLKEHYKLAPPDYETFTEKFINPIQRSN